MRFLQIIRWKNLLLIALIQILVKYYLIPLFNFESVLSNIQFVFLVLATVLIALGGNIINDIYDVEIDKINKPDKLWIPELATLQQAKISYVLLTSTGLVFSALVCWQIEKPLAILFFFIPVLTLFFYALYFKKRPFIGNLIVSFLVAFSIVLVAILESISLTTSFADLLKIESVIWGLSFFAFALNLLREIVKDMEDTIGDKALGVVSIPIKYGKEITHVVLKIIIGVLIGFLLAIVIIFYKKEPFLVGYLLFAVVSSLLLFVNQLNKVKRTTDYKKLSTLLKLIMLVGILSVFMINPT